MQEIIEKTELKANLHNLKHHMPEADQALCDFAKGLADSLTEDMTPEGFMYAYFDYQEQLNLGYLDFYTNLSQLVDLAVAICDPTFALVVKVRCIQMLEVASE